MTQEQYYSSSDNYGGYQYLPLSDVVNNFLLMYIGNDKQLNNVKRHEVIFHAKQAIKKLSYSTESKPTQPIELLVGDDLKFILPSDYVNYIRISINVNGVLRPLYENRQANSAVGYLQDNNNNLLFDSNGEALTGTSHLDLSRVTPTQYTGLGIYNGCMGWCLDDCWYFGYSVGPKYGLNPSDLFSGPSFKVNNGVIDFSSEVANQLVVLEYLSDGMANGVDANVEVHKFAEEFVYRYIKWTLLNAKASIPVYDRKLARDEKQAEYRNAKIKLMRLNPARLIPALRGQGNWIK
jgi:hypothetical protein